MDLRDGLHFHSNSAYDSANHVYFAVTGDWGIRGAFLGQDGQQLGPGFLISNDDGLYAGHPAILYLEQERIFFLAWHKATPDGSNQVVGRFVAYSSNGAPQFISAEFLILSKQSRMTTTPSVAYDPSRGVLAVAFQTWEPGGISAISVQRLSLSGSLLGSPVVLDNDGQWHDEAAIAYHPIRDEYLVLYAYCSGSGSELRSVRLNGSAQVIGGPRTLVTSGAVWQPRVEFNSNTGSYFAAWASPEYFAAYLSEDGAISGAVVTVSPGNGGYDGLGLAYNRLSHSYLFVMQDHESAKNLAVEVTEGLLPGPTFEIISDVGFGNFSPSVSGSTDRKEWLVMSSREYHATIANRVYSTR